MSPNDKQEKTKQIQFFNNNDMFAFLTAMCSVNCNLFDAPQTQFKASDGLVDMFKVKLLTFNMARKGLEYEFEKFIDMTNSKDIVVFGFQECKLTARTKVMDYFSKSLMSHGFDIVTSAYIWEMILVVAVASQHRHAVGNIKNFQKAKGFGNFIGNKAGLGCSFSVYESLFTVFNVHLHAGQKNMDKRIEMMSELSREYKLGNDNIDAIELSDYAFIIGDFNFRMSTTFSSIIDRVDTIRNEMHLDEFHIIKDKTNSFCNFTEGKKNFFPTYKREHNSNGYLNKKEQPPSWTDRVLIKNNCGRKIQIKEYNCLDEFYGSDHRPVYADLQIPIDYPESYQIIRNQYTSDALQYELISKIRINALIIKNLNVEYLKELIGNKNEFPCNIHCKFLGDFISAENGITTADKSLDHEEELKEIIKFKESECPVFS